MLSDPLMYVRDEQKIDEVKMQSKNGHVQQAESIHMYNAFVRDSTQWLD